MFQNKNHLSASCLGFLALPMTYSWYVLFPFLDPSITPRASVSEFFIPTLSSLVIFSLCEFLKIKTDLDFSVFFLVCFCCCLFCYFHFLLCSLPDNLGRSVRNNLQKLSYFIRASLLQIVFGSHPLQRQALSLPSCCPCQDLYKILSHKQTGN